MTAHGHKQPEGQTSARLSPETTDPGERHGLHKRLSKKKKDDLSSYKKAQEAVVNTLWQTVPKGLRLPVAALILIGGGLVASKSAWYPTLIEWLNPPAQRFAIGGRVLVKKDKGFPDGDVQLLNQKQEVVSSATTDGEGYVTFNISTENTITALRCQDQNGIWTSFSFKPKIGAAGKSFRVFLEEKRMEYDEP